MFISMMSFFNYKMGSKKGYIERGENFHYGIHMKCARRIAFTLLIPSPTRNENPTRVDAPEPLNL